MRLLLPLLLTACGTGGDAAAPAAQVVSLVIEPAQATIASGPAEDGTVAFTVTATFDDGTEGPLDLVSWSLSNDSAGSIDATGLFTATAENGAFTTVTATHNGITADAELVVVYEETIDEGSGMEATVFDGAPTGTIAWLYPEDGVSLPRNIPSLSFVWEDLAGAEGYRLSFTTGTTAVTVLTSDHMWTAEAERWVAIAATNAGGEVAIDVRALVGGVLYAAPTRTVHVNRLDAQGSIYYWSTTDRGIVKVPIAASEGELFYAPETNSESCVACHTVRGDRMGVTYQTEVGLIKSIGIADISGGQVTELGGRDVDGSFNTLNPAGTRMISTTDSGTLNFWNATTGELVGPIDSGGIKLNHPDWSPEGTMLAAISSVEQLGDGQFSDGALVVATIDDDGNLGPITTLYDPPPGRGKPNVFYPAFSPDGLWIAFNYGDSASYDNETAQLYVISVDGGTPIALTAANYGENLTNSWPHWGPQPDDDVYWLTFSSKRAYADIVTDGRPQIWVAAFDPELATSGLDPSSPAFWLPNQDIETSNHSTFWGP